MNQIIDPLTGDIQQILESEGGAQSKTDDKYIEDQFKYKGFNVIIGKFETPDHKTIYKAFAESGFHQLESSPGTQHEAGKEIKKYIDLMRRVN